MRLGRQVSAAPSHSASGAGRRTFRRSRGSDSLAASLSASRDSRMPGCSSVWITSFSVPARGS